MGNGDIFKGNVKLGGALEKLSPDAVGNLLSLGDKLSCIELGDNCFKDFVANGRKYTLVIVLTE